MPGSGGSGDIDILMDLKGNVAVVTSLAADFGLPVVSGGIRGGVFTADNVSDLYNIFVHGGISGGELGIAGLEATGSIEDEKLKNIGFVGQINVGGGAPFEAHVGYGNTEVIWEGTQKKFWNIIGDSVKKTWEDMGEYPKGWPFDSYHGGFS